MHGAGASIPDACSGALFLFARGQPFPPAGPSASLDNRTGAQAERPTPRQTAAPVEAATLPRADEGEPASAPGSGRGLGRPTGCVSRARPKQATSAARFLPTPASRAVAPGFPPSGRHSNAGATSRKKTVSLAAKPARGAAVSGGEGGLIRKLLPQDGGLAAKPKPPPTPSSGSTTAHRQWPSASAAGSAAREGAGPATRPSEHGVTAAASELARQRKAR
jgi:hypothetical protein